MSLLFLHPLSALCDSLHVPSPVNDPNVHGLCCDTRLLTQGMAFCAYSGVAVDGRDFMANAIALGACAIFYERDGVSAAQQQVLDTATVPVIGVRDLQQHIGPLASYFYGEPSRGIPVIATTGTNGKTTCSYLLADLLSRLQRKAAFMGTIGTGFPSMLDNSALTTPDAISLQQTIAGLREQGAQAIALEASSHGLHQGRLNGVAVKIAVLTNLTHDHLDYHGSQEHYAAAKRLLFELPGVEYAVLNADDAFGRELWNTLPRSLSKYRYGLSRDNIEAFNPKTDIVATDITMQASGIRAMLQTPWGNGELQCPLWGMFNVSNVLAVVTCLALLEYPLPVILNALTHISGVPGRLQRFGGDEQPLVIVDFAHTPDALAQVLRTLQAYKQGRLICVFGCGGDRDRSKRSQMGHIVAQNSDFFIITNDNPRTEAPQNIVADIMCGIEATDRHYAIELDREQAIINAVAMSQQGDIVLVAGKGHEQYQLIGDNKVYFSDQAQVMRALEAKAGRSAC